MGKKRKLDAVQEQGIVSGILAGLKTPEQQELGQMSLMQVLSWGAQKLLKEAAINEVTDYLGRARYQHQEAGQEFLGERNGFHSTTIDTPLGQVTYDL